MRETSAGALNGLDWLKCLAYAAKEVLRSGTSNKSQTLQLLAYGERRGQQLLGAPTEGVNPFFGLANESILAGLSEGSDEERGIAYLRAVARMSGWRCSEAYICRDLKCLADGRPDLVSVREIMTATPHSRGSRKRDVEGKLINEVAYARWLYVMGMAGGMTTIQDSNLRRAIDRQLKAISDRGEYSLQISDGPVRVPGGDWLWQNPPSLFSQEHEVDEGSAVGIETDTFICSSILNDLEPCLCFCQVGLEHHRQSLMYEPVARIGSFSLLLKREPKYGLMTQDNKYLDPPRSMERISRFSIQANAISTYLQYQANPTIQSGHSDRSFEHDERHDLGPLDILKGVREDCYYIEEIAKIYPMSVRRSRALLAIDLATQVYRQLKGATISLKIVDAPLDESPWLPRKKPWESIIARWDPGYCTVTPPSLPRSNALSCIAHFESESLILDPENFHQTLAIASRNSIFVIGVLTSDPYDTLPQNAVKWIIGDIGRNGVCLLVAPIDPKIRPLDNQYNLVNHAPYDMKREDNFRGTSLHLSFTDWTLPLESRGPGDRTIDQEACLLESVISVLDSGKWIADRDILCIDFESKLRMTTPKHCPGHPDGREEYDCTSLDSWEEFLDKPSSVGFFRAHRNWAARLAALSIMWQQGQSHCVGILGPE